MQIRYRPLRADTDFTSYRELFRLSFPETLETAVDSEQHYRWKFEQFPSSPSSYQYVGDDDGSIVGYYAALPYVYQVDGMRYRSAMVCDVMTHPGYRGKGIFTQIGRFATDELAGSDLAFTTGYPIRPEVIPGHLKVGWKVVQKMPTYVRPLGITGLMPAALQPLGKVVDVLIRGAQIWSLRGSSKYSTQTYERDQFLREIAGSEQYEAFLAAWIAGQPNALVKDRAFLDWRTSAPGTSYRFVVLRAGGKVAGLSLVRPTRLRGIETLAILDFMMLREHAQASRVLHAALVDVARKEHKDVVACMAAPGWAKTYGFARSCYLRTHAEFSLIVKKLAPDLADELLAEDRWHTFWIDSDDL